MHWSHSMVYIFQVYMYMLFHVQNDEQLTDLLTEHSTVFCDLKNYVCAFYTFDSCAWEI